MSSGALFPDTGLLPRRWSSPFICAVVWVVCAHRVVCRVTDHDDAGALLDLHNHLRRLVGRTTRHEAANMQHMVSAPSLVHTCPLPTQPDPACPTSVQTQMRAQPNLNHVNVWHKGQLGNGSAQASLAEPRRTLRLPQSSQLNHVVHSAIASLMSSLSTSLPPPSPHPTHRHTGLHFSCGF